MSLRTPHHNTTRTNTLAELRQAAKEIKANTPLSYGQIVELIKRCGLPLYMSDNALQQFCTNKEYGLRPDNRAALSEFLFQMPLGRLLRNPTFEGAPGFEQLLRTLTSGELTQPKGVDIQGLYFAYHGSHLKEHHYVIRAMQLVNAGQTITSMDYMNDNQTEMEREHSAPGVAVFFGDRVHIFALGQDNAVGFRLIVLSEFDPAECRGVGQMLGMTKNNEYFSRAIRVVREHPLELAPETNEERLDAMIRQTGIRTLNQWGDEWQKLAKEGDEPSGLKHSKAFRRFAEVKEKEKFPDPMLEFVSPDSWPTDPVDKKLDLP